jgi:hypothetical protein
MMKKNEVNQSTIKLAVLLLVNHCKTQPVDRLVSYDEIKDIVYFDPRQTSGPWGSVKGWIRFPREAWLWYLPV